MTARPLPFFKNRLREVSKQLYLEHGWQMPRGLMDSKERDPRNFTLDEWQQAKRVIGRHAGELKSLIQECWAVSDSRAAFAKALEERGLYLAKGDRRAHIALTFEGEAISIPKALGKKTKEVTARLGAADDLASVEQTRQRIATDILPRLKSHMDEARAQAAKELTPLDEKRRAYERAARRRACESRCGATSAPRTRNPRARGPDAARYGGSMGSPHRNLRQAAQTK
jgi:Arc/MetJ family transcription regulator